MRTTTGNHSDGPLSAANNNEARLARDAADLGRKAGVKRRRNESLHDYALRLQGLTYWLAFDAHCLLKHAEKLYAARPSNRPEFSPSDHEGAR